MGRIGACAALAATALLSLSSVTLAQHVIVESRSGGQNFDKYLEDPPGNWSSSSAKSTAPGTTTGIGSRFGFQNIPIFEVSPVLIAGATYDVDITHTSANSNTSQDVIMGVNITNVSTDPGDPQLPASTTLFQRGSAATSPNWGNLGRFKLLPGETTPALRFTYQSGFLAGGGGRVYADAIRFRLVGDPCQNTPDVGGVDGPVAAGMTSVIVRGVSGSASAVTVYADGVQIGQKTSGFGDPGDGRELVQVTPLVKGQRLQATQTINGQEGCKPGATTGPLVGGGANPAIGVSFGIRESLNNTGPIGAPGDTATDRVFWMPATGQILEFAGAAAGTIELTPGKCWQTVSAQRGIDPVYRWAGTGGQELAGDFGTLDGLHISIREDDTGPYRIYIDEIWNGSTLIQNFEDGAVQFLQPSFSGSTSHYLLLDGDFAFLNSSINSTAFSDRGTRSGRPSWQFRATTNLTQALRLLAGNAAGGGTPYPQVDLRLPLSVRILVLPVGVVPGVAPEITEVTVTPANATSGIGGSLSFEVEATGTGTLTYEWLVNGVPTGGNTDSLTLTNLQLEDDGARVSVAICDDEGSVRSQDIVITVTDCPVPFADADGDGDVDHDDFGAFQACYDPLGVPPGCSCWDRNDDGKIDGMDFNEFKACVTGPSVPFDINNPPPGCTP